MHLDSLRSTQHCSGMQKISSGIASAIRFSSNGKDYLKHAAAYFAQLNSEAKQAIDDVQHAPAKGSPYTDRLIHNIWLYSAPDHHLGQLPLLTKWMSNYLANHKDAPKVLIARPGKKCHFPLAVLAAAENVRRDKGRPNLMSAIDLELVDLMPPGFAQIESSYGITKKADFSYFPALEQAQTMDALFKNKPKRIFKFNAEQKEITRTDLIKWYLLEHPVLTGENGAGCVQGLIKTVEDFAKIHKQFASESRPFIAHLKQYKAPPTQEGPANDFDTHVKKYYDMQLAPIEFFEALTLFIAKREYSAKVSTPWAPELTKVMERDPRSRVYHYPPDIVDELRHTLKYDSHWQTPLEWYAAKNPKSVNVLAANNIMQAIGTYYDSTEHPYAYRSPFKKLNTHPKGFARTDYEPYFKHVETIMNMVKPGGLLLLDYSKTMSETITHHLSDPVQTILKQSPFFQQNFEPVSVKHGVYRRKQ